MRALCRWMRRAKLRRIRLDGRQMDDRAKCFVYLQAQLSLPEYFGHNLDALADSLGELRDVSISLHHGNAMRNALGEYAQRMMDVFVQEAAKRTDFVFRLIPD